MPPLTSHHPARWCAVAALCAGLAVNTYPGTASASGLEPTPGAARTPSSAPSGGPSPSGGAITDRGDPMDGTGTALRWTGARWRSTPGSVGTDADSATAPGPGAAADADRLRILTAAVHRAEAQDARARGERDRAQHDLVAVRAEVKAAEERLARARTAAGDYARAAYTMGGPAEDFPLTQALVDGDADALHDLDLLREVGGTVGQIVARLGDAQRDLAAALARLRGLVTERGLAATRARDRLTQARTALAAARTPALDVPPASSAILVPDVGPRPHDREASRTRHDRPTVAALVVGVDPDAARTVPLRVVDLQLQGRAVRLAVASPRTITSWGAGGVAGASGLWHALGRGGVVLSPDFAAVEELPLGGTAHGVQGSRRPTLAVLGYAELGWGVDGVIGARDPLLGRVSSRRAWLVADPGATRRATLLAPIVRAARTAHGSVDVLLPLSPAPGDFADPRRAAQRLGTLRYLPVPGSGAIRPFDGWNRRMVTDSVPVLGEVTCNRLLLPQLRGALAELEARGLSALLDPGAYGGCYNPRLIADRAVVSRHAWGLAVDLQVAGNERGKAGAIDRRVVAVFKRWGFAWGGDWTWTDPMHFELRALLEDTR